MDERPSVQPDGDERGPNTNDHLHGAPRPLVRVTAPVNRGNPRFLFDKGFTQSPHDPVLQHGSIIKQDNHLIQDVIENSCPLAAKSGT